MPEFTELLRLLQFKPKSVQHPNAWIGHTPFAYWVVKKLKPQTFVELGTHTGNSYFAFCQSIQENETQTIAFAVDTWDGDAHAGFYGEDIFASVQLTNLEYSSFSTLLRSTFDSAVENFSDGSVDLLHIDGFHSYEAVRHDFETWLPKMSSKGVVLLHDTSVRRDDFGVHRLWSELSSQYNSLEFFHSHGLGIIELSQESNVVVPAADHEKNNLRVLFASLSEQMLIRFERDSLLTERDSLLGSGSWRITRGIRAVWRFFAA